MNKKERFLKAYEYLKKYGIVNTQLDVATKIGAYSQNISRVFSGEDKYLTSSFLNKFNNAFNNIFNIEWLLTGEGEMLSPTADPTSIINSNNTVQNNSTMSIGNKELEKELMEMLKRKDDQIDRKDEQIKEQAQQINTLLRLLGERK